MTAIAQKPASVVPHRSRAMRLLRWMRSDIRAVLSIGFLVFLLLVSILAPVIAPYAPTDQNVSDLLSPPSAAHWLGTDDLGRDVLSRLIYGAPNSLYASFLAVAVAVLLGVPIGLLIGFVGGWFDEIVSRFIDALLSFPPIVLAIAVTGALGIGLTNAMLAVGFVFAPFLARIVRAQTLVVKSALYVDASRGFGASTPYIIWQHILPNAIQPVIVQVTLALAIALLAEAALSFLSLGRAATGGELGRHAGPGLQLHRDRTGTDVRAGHGDHAHRPRFQRARRIDARRARPDDETPLIVDSIRGLDAMPDGIAALDRAARLHATPCGDGTMVWREWGAGVPVVLLHGGTGSWLHWVRNIRRFNDAGFRAIVPDLPGLGDSAMPPPTQNLDDVSDIIWDGLSRVLAPDERFHLVGFSFGGHLSGRVGVHAEGRLRSLTLVGAGGLGLPRGRASNLRRVEPTMSSAEIAALQRDNLGRFMVHDPAKIDEAAVWMQIRHVAIGRFKSVPFARGDWLARALPLLKAPIGGIWGEFDITAYPFIDQRETLLRAIQPEAKFHVVAGVGHWVQYEGADEFNRVLLDWLARS